MNILNQLKSLKATLARIESEELQEKTLQSEEEKKKSLTDAEEATDLLKRIGPDLQKIGCKISTGRKIPENLTFRYELGEKAFFDKNQGLTILWPSKGALKKGVWLGERCKWIFLSRILIKNTHPAKIYSSSLHFFLLDWTTGKKAPTVGEEHWNGGKTLIDRQTHEDWEIVKKIKGINEKNKLFPNFEGEYLDLENYIAQCILVTDPKQY